jgi:Holliday junction resolvasome RuvABC DNA-binding subunit
VLELKERIAPLAAIADAPHLGAGDGHVVARDALVELGYSAAEAEQRLAETDPDLPPAERVRQALRAA